MVVRMQTVNPVFPVLPISQKSLVEGSARNLTRRYGHWYAHGAWGNSCAHPDPAATIAARPGTVKIGQNLSRPQWTTSRQFSSRENRLRGSDYFGGWGFRCAQRIYPNSVTGRTSLLGIPVTPRAAPSCGDCHGPEDGFTQ